VNDEASGDGNNNDSDEDNDDEVDDDTALLRTEDLSCDFVKSTVHEYTRKSTR
jgi:hypothetical protein